MQCSPDGGYGAHRGSEDQGCGALSRVMGHCCVVFWEVWVHIFCPFKNWVVSSVLNCKYSVHNVDTSSLSEASIPALSLISEGSSEVFHHSMYLLIVGLSSMCFISVRIPSVLRCSRTWFCILSLFFLCIY